MRAVSPILATLLLFVLAVAAIGMTYAWIMTYVGSTTQKAGAILYKSNVSFYNDSSGTTKIGVDIGDSGSAGTQILQVCIGTSSFSVTSQTTTPAVPVPISAGSTVWVTLTYNWTRGATYFFKVVPATGVALAFQAQAP
jgi:flagellin-like protein